MVVLAVYSLVISGIPFIKAVFTEKLTMDDLTINYENRNSSAGFYIVSLKPEGKGEIAGLKIGDKILALDGKYLENSSDIKIILSSKNTGDFVPYLIKRGNTTFIANVEVYKYFHLIYFIFYFLGLGFLINGFIVGYSRPKEIHSCPK
jgi:membrane-associated protease RseP (regulator of RpoE activity)